MKQTIEIEVPDGKKAIWKDGTIVFEDLKPKLPKTWEEFCEQNEVKDGEYYIGTISNLVEVTAENYFHRRKNFDRNILPNKKAAEQHLALIQLHQLRDCYRQGWIPTVGSFSFGIIRRVGGDLDTDRFMQSSRFLSFQSSEIAQEFLNNFRYLIVQAGDLI